MLSRMMLFDSISPLQMAYFLFRFTIAFDLVAIPSLQVVPHITDALQDWIVGVSKKPVDNSDQEVYHDLVVALLCYVLRTPTCSLCFSCL